MTRAQDRIAALVKAARAHKLVVGGARDITRLLGVLYACTRLHLIEEDTEGYDARDDQRLRVQIKSRAPEVGHHVKFPLPTTNALFGPYSRHACCRFSGPFSLRRMFGISGSSTLKLLCS